MNKTFLRSIGITLLGIISGIGFGFILRSAIICEILGIAIAIKVGGISDRKTGSIYGAIIGSVIGGFLGTSVIVNENVPFYFYISMGIFGGLLGALIGRVACKIFNSKKTWLA